MRLTETTPSRRDRGAEALEILKDAAALICIAGTFYAALVAIAAAPPADGPADGPAATEGEVRRDGR